MRLLFASNNAGKLRELRELVGGALEVVSPSEIGLSLEVEEDEQSFEGNARKKARAFGEASGLAALADDSGLCVDALGGRPGVQSARYAPSEKERIDRLLGELVGVPRQKRGARFVCSLCLWLPSGRSVCEAGECEGEIALAPSGTGGFGYDPVFYVPALGQTLAEVTSKQKSAISHRGRAFEKMRPWLVALAKGELA